MPSFDVVSKVEIQILDNAINTVNRELSTRYDFKGTDYNVELDKKTFIIKVHTDSDMKMEQLVDIILSKGMRAGIEPTCFDMTKDANPNGKVIRKEIPVKNGLAQEDSKKIVKLIKDSGLKVQAAIQGDVVRVTGKKIDDLQDVIALCNTSNLGLPLQYINMKS